MERFVQIEPVKDGDEGIKVWCLDNKGQLWCFIDKKIRSNAQGYTVYGEWVRIFEPSSAHWPVS